MGIPDKLLHDTHISEHFRCSICLQIAYPPFKTNCEHLFCEACIFEWLKKNSSCPLDRNEIGHVQKDNLLNRVFEEFEIKCPLNPERCEWKGRLEQSQQHVSNECMYSKVSCPECHFECLRIELETHLENCEYRKVQCKYCGEWKSLKDELHYKKCSKYPEECEMCHARVPRSETHKCPLAKIQCPIEGCAERILRMELEKHLNDNLAAHLQLQNTFIQKISQQILELKEENQQQKLEMLKLASEKFELEKMMSKMKRQMHIQRAPPHVFLITGITSYNMDDVIRKDFEADGCRWYIEVYPNGKTCENRGHVAIYMFSNESIPLRTHFILTLHTADGKEKSHSIRYDFRSTSLGIGCPNFVSHSELGWKFDSRTRNSLKVSLRVSETFPIN